MPPTPSKKANFSSQLARQYSGQYTGCAEVIIEREVCEMLNGFLRFFIQLDNYGPNIFSKWLNIANNFSVCIKTIIIIYRYIVLVTS